jgi:hypothetical protein
VIQALGMLHGDRNGEMIIYRRDTVSEIYARFQRDALDRFMKCAEDM